MLKVFNESAKALFAERFEGAYSTYKLKKSLRGPLPGAFNFECRESTQKVSWICFGGFKERDFAVLAAWTVSGKDLKSLDEWEQYGNPRAFEVPPRPVEGYVDLRDRWRFEQSPALGTWCLLQMEEPPQEFALKVFERHIASEAYRLSVQRQFEGAMRLNTKNPPSFEQVRDDAYAVERNYCLNLWSHLADRHAFTEHELHRFLLPVVDKALELVHLHGMPLLEERLAQFAV